MNDRLEVLEKYKNMLDELREAVSNDPSLLQYVYEQIEIAERRISQLEREGGTLGN